MADTSVSYKCPNCDAPLSFKPGHDKVSCEYCGAELDISAVENLFKSKQEMAAKTREAQEAKWATKEAGSDWSAEEEAAMKAFTCSSCGAEIVCDENTMATECVYCGNPTMVPSRFTGMLKPDYVIPFKKTKEDAVNALKKFYEGKKLLPDAFTANNRVEAIQPMYVPFWLFDSEVEAHANFKAEKIRTRETSTEIIRESHIYNCARGGTMKFHMIPVDGSKKMDDTYMESIEPFDYSDLVPFSAAYFTGYLADKYDVDAETSIPRADDRVEKTAVDVLRSTVQGYDTCQEETHAVIKSKGDVKYAMVPVWILTTRYQDKPYTFMMNAQTGKIVGSLPYDSGKAFKYMAICSVIMIPIIYFIVSFLLNM